MVQPDRMAELMKIDGTARVSCYIPNLLAFVFSRLSYDPRLKPKESTGISVTSRWTIGKRGCVGLHVANVLTRIRRDGVRRQLGNHLGQLRTLVRKRI